MKTIKINRIYLSFERIVTKLKMKREIKREEKKKYTLIHYYYF